MLVDLCLNLVTVEVVDLPDARACAHRLAEDDIQETQFAVDGRLDGEVVLALADHHHVDPHVGEALAHLCDFHRAVEAVLLGAVLHQLQAAARQLVILLCLQEVLAGDEAVFKEGFLRLVGASVTLHLHLQLQFLLLDAQLLLLHLNHGVAQDVLLLGEVGLGVEDLHVEVLVAEDEDDIAGIDAAAFLGHDLLHHAAFQGTDLDGRHGRHLSADADVVVELALGDGAHGDVVRVDAEFLGIVPEDEPEDEGQEQGTAPERQGFFGEGQGEAFLLFDFTIH